MVSNVGVTSSTSSSSSVHSQECVTGGDNAQLGITLNPSQIRASDISDNSLPGSSGDIPIVAPTPAAGITYASNPEIRVTWMSGDTITTLPKGINLSEARRLIRAAVADKDVHIDFMRNHQKITEAEFASDQVTGDIQCVLRKRAYILSTPGINEDQSELAEVLDVPQLTEMFGFILQAHQPDVPQFTGILNFMLQNLQNLQNLRYSQDSLDAFNSQYHLNGLNGFSSEFFYELFIRVITEFPHQVSKLIMVAKVDNMPSQSTAAEVLISKGIEALQFMLEAKKRAARTVDTQTEIETLLTRLKNADNVRDPLIDWNEHRIVFSLRLSHGDYLEYQMYFSENGTFVLLDDWFVYKSHVGPGYYR